MSYRHLSINERSKLEALHHLGLPLKVYMLFHHLNTQQQLFYCLQAPSPLVVPLSKHLLFQFLYSWPHGNLELG